MFLAHPGAIGVFQALLTPLVAVIALGIAFAQWWTARSRLKLDLFDRRWAVYQATRTMLAELVTHARASAETERAFLGGIRGAKWLFDDRVDWYLAHDLWPRVAILGREISLDEPRSVSERTMGERTRVELMRWAAGQDPVIDSMFGRYLRVDEGVLSWIRTQFAQRWRRQGPNADNAFFLFGRR